MAGSTVRILYDLDGDYPEVMFDKWSGYFREVSEDQIMMKLDETGTLLG
jgi:hypothetical protein